MKRSLFTLFLIAISGCLLAQAIYKNSKMPVDVRVADLLSRMTTEEKVAQLCGMNFNELKLNDAFLNDPTRMDSAFRNGAGMINHPFDNLEDFIKARNKIQTYLKTKTKLGIPVIFTDDGHHGLGLPGSNSFPQSIGFACSWDTLLFEKVYNFIGKEANARGTSLVLSPVVDVCLEPRWGRISETYGEDPYLNGMLGSATVQGFQGNKNGDISPGHVATTLKHFAGHGQPESGTNTAPANYSVRVIREFHMEPFRLCIQRSKPACIMASYNEVDGIPSHANKWLLKDVLRNEWNFEGVVVSDFWGITQLYDRHCVEANSKDAAFRAFSAGVTVDLPYGGDYKNLTELVKENKILLADLNKEVARVLTLKFKLGLFEDATIDLQKSMKASADSNGRILARKAAQESMVLLKNENNLLPIKKGQFKKIAIIGPCAAVNFLGDYSGVPLKNISLLQGLKNKVGNDCEILFAQGCKLTNNGDSITLNNMRSGNAEFPTAAENQQLINEAVEVAKQADFVIIAVGENEQLCRETWTNHLGDNLTLDLLSNQEELVKAIAATKKPVLVYLMHGRPLTINWISENIPAIIDGWYMGQEAGNAFADILFGDVCPSGKLTITYPRSVGQLPMYYNYKPSARLLDYVSGKTSPLYPFGFGLSYTTFKYSDLLLSANSMHKGGLVIASINVTNTGKMNGDEIVQLYIRDKVSSVTRPVKELKDFARITLNSGETKKVTFRIDASKLAFWTADMKYEVEPGSFDIMIGKSSEDVQKIELFVK